MITGTITRARARASSGVFLGTALVCAGIFSSGCFWVTTKHEGKQIKKDVAAIDGRLQKQEESVGSKVTELEDVLAKATKLLARNSADLGAELAELERDNARLAGLVSQASELTNELKAADARQRKLSNDRFDELEKRLAQLEEKVNRIPAKTAATLYQEGKAAFDAANYKEAYEAFKSLVIKYSDDPLADDAQYYRGEALYKQSSYQLALGELQKVFEKFPTSTWAPKALFRAGEAATNLKWCTDARAYYGLLRQKYPKSDLVKKAKAADTKLRKWAKNKKYCQS